MKKLGLFFILFLYLIFTFRYSILLKESIINTCILFVTIIMPSFIPIYFLGNFLLNYSFLSKIFFPILKHLLPLENTRACSIYLLSFILGNPSTTILINNSLKDNLITKKQAKNLMSITFFMNPLFIINVLPINISLPIIIGSIISSVLIGLCINKQVTYNIDSLPSNSIWHTLDQTPSILLNILIIMIFMSIIKLPFYVINKPFILADFLDISSGLINFIKYPISELYLIILSIKILFS